MADGFLEFLSAKRTVDDRDRFRDWVSVRFRQIDQAELILIARNLDFFGKAPGKDALPSSQARAYSRAEPTSQVTA